MEGNEGGKWDNSNSIINKIYFFLKGRYPGVERKKPGLKKNWLYLEKHGFKTQFFL